MIPRTKSKWGLQMSHLQQWREDAVTTATLRVQRARNRGTSSLWTRVRGQCLWTGWTEDKSLVVCWTTGGGPRQISRQQDGRRKRADRSRWREPVWPICTALGLWADVGSTPWFGSAFSSKIMIYEHCLVTMSRTIKHLNGSHRCHLLATV